MRPRPLRSLDLFSGIGGFALGFRRAGIKTVAFCEIDPYARAVLAKNFSKVPIYWDVKNLNAKRLIEDGVDLPNIVCGGFPCQDISTAGKGAGLSGARSGLWFEFLRIIDETRPRWAVVENVSALRNRGLDTVLRGLAEIGYDAEWHCIPAAAVGAPHRRDRVWVVADAGCQHGDGRAQLRAGNCVANRPRFTERAQEVGSVERSSADVAHAPVVHRDGGELHAGSGREGTYQAAEFRDGGRYADVAGANGAGLAQREGERSDARPKLAAIERADWWLAEPDVGRVVNGISTFMDRLGGVPICGAPVSERPQSSRVARLRCLGNAVVPQIPELIGRAILKTSKRDSA